MTQTISFRAEDDLADLLAEFAEESDTAKSQVLRDALKHYLSQNDDAPNHLAFEAARESIKSEENPKQKRAWFRSNVAGQLLTAWNGGLNPDEATDYLNGRLREAKNLHEEEDLAEFVRDGLARYEAAHETQTAVTLTEWCKERRSRDAAEQATKAPTETPDDEAFTPQFEEDQPDERYQCAECGANYGPRHPPNSVGVCDVCDADLPHDHRLTDDEGDR